MEPNIDSGEARVIAAHLQHINSNVDRLSTAVESMRPALAGIDRLEQAHGHVLKALEDGGKRMADHDARLQTIERAMPGLVELRRWVILGVLAGVGMIGAALVKLVIYDVPRIAPAVAAVAPAQKVGP